MPNTVHIKRVLRKEPTTREDYFIRRMKKLGMLPCKEERVYSLPKAPGVFSLGPDYEPVQVPNSAVTQPVKDESEGLDVTGLKSLQNSMKGLF